MPSHFPSHFQDATITIHKIKCGPYDNNAYVLVCPETNESILIDTPQDPGELIRAARQTQVKAILITHNHTDHIQGFSEVITAIDAPVGIGEPDSGALPTSPAMLLRDGDTITAGTITLLTIATPGHTMGSTCLTFGSHLFSGDTLFPNGPGRTRTPENLKQIIESITSRLYVLPDETSIYPGHGDDGNLKMERDKYQVFASREHPDDLCGDVDWLES